MASVVRISRIQWSEVREEVKLKVGLRYTSLEVLLLLLLFLSSQPSWCAQFAQSHTSYIQ